jgi:hypothetical protein
VYNPLTFETARGCEARVWDFFVRAAPDQGIDTRFLDYVTVCEKSISFFLPSFLSFFLPSFLACFRPQSATARRLTRSSPTPRNVTGLEPHEPDAAVH